MRVLGRILHLASADAHGVLDAVEDRGLVLRQHLRNAEIELERKRVEHAQLCDARECLERRRALLTTRQAECDADIRLAIERGQEDLARFSIRRFLESRSLDRRLELECAELGAEEERVKKALDSQRQEFEELSARVEAELQDLELRRSAEAARQARSGWGAEGRDAPGLHGKPGEALRGISDEEVELEWLRRHASAAQTTSKDESA